MLIASWLTILLAFIGTPVILYFCWKRHTYMSMSIGILNVIIFVVQALFYGRALLNITPLRMFTYEQSSQLLNQYYELSLMWYETGFRPIMLAGEQTGYLYTLYTSMFVHNGLLHIIGNTLFLILFGVPFEERVGWKRVAIIYIGAGLLGSVAKGGLDLILAGRLGFDPTVTNIGASVAIAGIMGAFLYLYPRDKIFAPIGFFVMRAPVYLAVMIFVGYESFLAFSNQQDNISHFGHIFGLIMGYALAPIAVRLSAGEGRDEKEKRRSSIDTQRLRPLVTNRRLDTIYDRIAGEDEPDVRDAWIEEFVDSIECPACGGDLTLSKRGKVSCERCDYELRL